MHMIVFNIFFSFILAHTLLSLKELKNDNFSMMYRSCILIISFALLRKFFEPAFFESFYFYGLVILAVTTSFWLLRINKRRYELLGLALALGICGQILRLI